MLLNIGYGHVSSNNNPRFLFARFLWFFFTALCVICMLTCRNLVVQSMLPLFLADGDETSLLDSPRPLLSSSNHIGQQQCGIWMAPSSLRPFPGYGIFTTRDIDKGDSILGAPDAVSIPLHDMRRKNEHNPLYRERRRLWRNVFSNVGFLIDFCAANGVDRRSREQRCLRMKRAYIRFNCCLDLPFSSVKFQYSVRSMFGHTACPTTVDTIIHPIRWTFSQGLAPFRITTV